MRTLSCLGELLVQYELFFPSGAKGILQRDDWFGALITPCHYIYETLPLVGVSLCGCFDINVDRYLFDPRRSKWLGEQAEMRSRVLEEALEAALAQTDHPVH